MNAQTIYRKNLDVIESVSMLKFDKTKHADIFKSLYIRKKYSLSKLSFDHRLLIINLGFLSETHKEVLNSFAYNMKHLLKKNTIPIIFHQESPRDIIEFQRNSEAPHVRDLIFLRIDEDIVLQLDLYFDSPTENIGLTNLGINVVTHKVFDKRKSMFALLFVEDGGLTKRVVFQPGTRVDFCGVHFLDLGVKRNGDNEKEYFQSLLNIFPNFAPDALMRIVLQIVRKFSEEEKKSLADDFNQCLTLAYKRFYYKKFAASEVSSEPLDFYEECLQYQGVYNLEQKIKKAERIAEIFLGTKKTKPLLPVNTNQKNIDFVLDIIEKAKKYQEFPYDDLFENVVKDLKSTVLIDTYLRFKQSEQYKEMMEIADKRSQYVTNYIISFNPNVVEDMEHIEIKN